MSTLFEFIGFTFCLFLLIRILVALFSTGSKPGEPASDWIPVTEELPDAEITVQISNPEWPGDPVTNGWYDGETWYEIGGSPLDADMAPTHWQHLPEPPVRKEANNA